MILLWILFGITALVLLTAYICFLMAFHVSKKKKENQKDFDLPPGEIYEPYHEKMLGWMKDVRALPHKEVTIQSFDGLTLYGKYYECAPGAPMEIMFHGYRGSAERDLCGGALRAFALGRNALVVDQRAGGRSEGNVISFGINEHRDCLAWIDYSIAHFGGDVKIILTGISMGAATVMMAAGKPLSKNVIGVLADCGYTSPKEIIMQVIHEMKLPEKLLYPFVKLGARLYGHFDLEETSPLAAVKHCSVPVIFFHGETDDYVPCRMSIDNYAACVAPKKLVTVPNAGHGMAYLMDPNGYLQALKEFFDPLIMPSPAGCD